MKKIIWLIITCLVAALVSFAIVNYPGVVGFFIDDYLITMPLWLFIIACLAFVGVMIVFLRLLKIMTLGPKKIYQRSRKIQQQKQVDIAANVMIASIIKDADGIERYHGKTLAFTPALNGITQGLYWQYLYQNNQLKVLGTLLKQHQKDMSDNVIWRYYQGLLYLEQSKYTEAADLLTKLVKKYPNSQIINQKLIECHAHLLDYQRVLQCINHSKVELDLEFRIALIQRMLNSLHHLGRLQKLWQALSIELKQQSPLVVTYLSRLYQIGEKNKAIALLQKALIKELSLPLIQLYFSLKDTDGTYEFIKSEWLKTSKKHQEILLTLLLKALKYKDWEFLKQYLDKILINDNSVAIRARHALMSAALYDHQSMHSQALQLKTQAQQLLLDGNLLTT